MSAHIMPSDTISSIPESPPDTPASIRSWRVMVSRSFNSLLKGAVSTPVTAVGNAAYFILPSDLIVQTSAAFTAPRIWTLPLIKTITLGAGVTPESIIGYEITIMDAIATVTGVNTLSIVPSGSDKINGGAGPIVLNAAGTALTLISDGQSNWAVKSRYL